MRNVKWSIFYSVFRSIIVGLALFLVSCTPEAEEVTHTKRLMRVQTKVFDYFFIYGEEGKIKTITKYDTLGTVVDRTRNTYDSKGYLVERLIENYKENIYDTVFWKETFTYKKGLLVNGYYRRLDRDSITVGYRNHDVLSGENGIEAFAHNTYLQKGVYYRIKRGLSTEGNIEWQEKAFETFPDVVSERQDISYDDQQNPFRGIGFYDPFDMRHVNHRNITENSVTGDSRNTEVYRHVYEYEGGYPTLHRTDVYNVSEELIFSSTEYYYYE